MLGCLGLGWGLDDQLLLRLAAASAACLGLSLMLRGRALRVAGLLAMVLGVCVSAAGWLLGGWGWLALVAGLLEVGAGVATFGYASQRRPAAAATNNDSPWAMLDAGTDPTDPTQDPD